MTFRTFEIGDRVELARDTLMDRKGSLGMVVEKFVPMHCTGVWSITVLWDGNKHRTSYPYPTGGMLNRREAVR
jgi:hypothetical protein